MVRLKCTWEGWQYRRQSWRRQYLEALGPRGSWGDDRRGAWAIDKPARGCLIWLMSKRPEAYSCVYLSSVPLLGRHVESRVPLSVNSVNPNRVEYQELTGHHTARQDTLVDGCPSFLIGVPRTDVHCYVRPFRQRFAFCTDIAPIQLHTNLHSRSAPNATAWHITGKLWAAAALRNIS